jgi:amino acid adenylation domain-containing protein
MSPDTPRLMLLGIGGSGMLPLALLLREAGYQVTGSDPGLTDSRRALLESRDITVCDDSPDAVGSVDQLIVSPAVPHHHPVLRAARRLGLEPLRRSEALARLLRNRCCICVAGSHGKSTTTAMLCHILTQAGKRFGYFLGAEIEGQAPARLGKPGTDFVLEACEAHGALVDWVPAHIVLTNVDNDHSAHYGGQTALESAILELLQRAPPQGQLVLCGDDSGVQALIRRLDRPAITFGFKPGNYLRASLLPDGHAELTLDCQPIGRLSLGVPGRHNQLNAMAALLMAKELGVQVHHSLAYLATFSGVQRRLQEIGTVRGARVFDDFAHHPAEISASLNALREAGGRLVAVLQPQLGSRVHEMASAFACALSLADWRLVLPVEMLGEARGTDNADARLLEACAAAGVDITVVSNLPDLVTHLDTGLRPKDVVVFMAGRSGEDLAQRFCRTLLGKITTAHVEPSVVWGHQTLPPTHLIDTICSQAQTTPEAIAVQMGSRALSYGHLMARSNDLARRLQAKGAKAGATVAVCLGRTVDRVTAFLAVLRIGSVYLPIDPQQPKERIEWMLRASAACCIVVNHASPALPELGLDFVNVASIADRDVEAADFGAVAEAKQMKHLQALAYLIFTSGSTGQPKGVEVEHGCIANYAAAAARHFAIGPGARVSLVTGFGFDVSIGDMAMTLAAGGSLHLPTDAEALPGPMLARFLKQARLTHLSITPSALNALPAIELPDLSCVIVVGEACHPALVARWAQGRRFFNAYGPTEATVEATFAQCQAGETITIGGPIDNMAACVLDENHRLIPRGEVGELGLFGIGLARGYLGRPDLTAAAFVPVELPDGSVPRVYLTGDRVFMDPGGALNFLGRLDDQFKFRGHRIEPGEIEAVLCDFSMIAEAVVSKLELEQGERLIAHVVLRPGTPVLDQAALRTFLDMRLPNYMHPSVVLPLHAIARTANGKLNRAALPLPPKILVPAPTRLPADPIEQRLMEMLSQSQPDITVGDVRQGLQDTGLDSLGLSNFILQIESEFNITLDMVLEHGNDSVETLALAIRQRVNVQTVEPETDLASQLMTLLRPHLAGWPGVPRDEAQLIRELRMGMTKAPKLFWCFQGGGEFAALTDALGDRIRLFGLRSGHLVFSYDTATMTALAGLYADGIEQVAPNGALFLGGNCQGGHIMAKVTQELQRRGRQVALVILMELTQFSPLSGAVLLLFGERSYLNPYDQIEAPERMFAQAYADGFQVAMLPGGHGEYFQHDNVPALAEILVTRIEAALQKLKCESAGHP